MTIPDSSDINRQSDPIDNNETLLRLLCSPLHYNEELNLVNPDAFDLRILKNDKPEDYVSLARISQFTSEELTRYLSTKGYQIWDDKKHAVGHYYGYGTFNCKDAREVHSMIEINPLNGSDATHIGLFYKALEGGYYCGPLPKDNVEVLETLSDLADLLSVKVAPKRL